MAEIGSTITVGPSMEPEPWQPEEMRPKPVHIKCIIAHEQGDMLEHRTLMTVGKSQKQISEEAKAIMETPPGFKENGQTFDRIDFIEVRNKPKLFLAEYSGDSITLSNWINGVQLQGENGFEQISPAHARSWVLSEPKSNGQEVVGYKFEMDKAKVEANFRDPRRFSELVWTTWDKLKEMR